MNGSAHCQYEASGLPMIRKKKEEEGEGGVEADAWQLQIVQYLDETQPARLPLSKAVLLSFMISRWHLKTSDRKNN